MFNNENLIRITEPLIYSIKNPNHLHLLKSMCAYYTKGLNANIDEISTKDILAFLKDYYECNKKLLAFMYSKGLDDEKSKLEITPSPLLSFINSNKMVDTKCLSKYKLNFIDNNVFDDSINNSILLTGIINNNDIELQDNYELDVKDHVIINNSMNDLFKKFKDEQHSIAVAEKNDLDFYSGFCIKKDNPFKRFIVQDFCKSVGKTVVANEVDIINEDGYTYGLVRRLK